MGPWPITGVSIILGAAQYNTECYRAGGPITVPQWILRNRYIRAPGPYITKSNYWAQPSSYGVSNIWAPGPYITVCYIAPHGAI